MLERHRGTLQLPRWVKFVSDQRFQHKKPLEGVSRRCAGSGGSLLLPSSCTEPSAMGNDTNALICWWRSPAVQPLTRKSDLFLAQEGRSCRSKAERAALEGRMMGRPIRAVGRGKGQQSSSVSRASSIQDGDGGAEAVHGGGGGIAALCVLPTARVCRDGEEGSVHRTALLQRFMDHSVMCRV